MAVGGDFTWNDRYAGDEAWAEWFEVCSVDGCRAAHAARLREEISSAMYAQLARCGVARADAGGDDPVAFFDSYFKLRGSRDRPKPLKQYFRHRIADEGLDLADFVCGTLFGSSSGRIRDIVVDWISVLKGWKPRTVTDDGGRRHLVWESSAGEADGDGAGESEEVEFLDEGEYRREARGLVAALARRTRSSRSDVALVVYATAYGIALTEPGVRAALGVGKSQAYQLRARVMAAMARELRGSEVAGSALFGRVLVETCVGEMADDVRAALGACEP